jgi:hypothetical protein
MKIGGLFSKIGPRKGIFLSYPLDSESAAEIRWEGEREKQPPELGVEAAAPPLPRRGARWRCPKRHYGARFDELKAPG